MSNIDLATGLPELPEGYYWKLAEDSYYWESVVVSICKKVTTQYVMKKKFWFGSHRWEITDEHKVFSSFILNDMGRMPPSMVTPKDILKTAERVFEMWQESRIQQAKAAETRKLYGTYPPKKLVQP